MEFVNESEISKLENDGGSGNVVNNYLPSDDISKFLTISKDGQKAERIRQQKFVPAFFASCKRTFSSTSGAYIVEKESLKMDG